MICQYGNYDFVVDFDTDFIMFYNCYQDGKECLNCPEYENCSEELDFVMEQLRGQNV